MSIFLNQLNIGAMSYGMRKEEKEKRKTNLTSIFLIPFSFISIF